MPHEPVDVRPVVLVVDDEEAMVEVFEDTLHRLPLEVVSERDPQRASALLQDDARRYDLLLLDLRMPHVDGVKLLERTRARRPTLPVIIVTGYPTRDSLERCRGLGVLHYLRKPFDPEELLRHVRSALARRPA